MYLTKEEERIIGGEYGEGYKKMLEVLVKIGEIYNADSLIPIKSAQISGVSYNTIGEHGLHFLKSLKGVKVKVPSTLNPLAFDEKHIEDLKVSGELFKKQMEIIKSYLDMGIRATMTCTPYYYNNIPKFGEHIAWAESSAVIYANSIIGARTNREGSISALASAIIGKTPNYGLHLERNRKASTIVDVNFEMSGEDYPLLGLYIGENVGGIPYLRIRGNDDDFKLLGAAMAASGSIAMFHIENYTPEFKNAIDENIERIVIERRDLEKYRGVEENIDLVAIGCPHASKNELRKIAEFIKGKEKRRNVELWIFTAKSTKEKSEEYVKIIEKFGGKVMIDTCVVVSNTGKIYKKIGTTSGKAAFYLRKKKFGGANVVVRDLYTLLRSVIE